MITELINRYRPEDYSEVIGQDAVVRALEAAVEKRAAKAFLFSGPSGVGKTTLARITAAKLGCLSVDLLDFDAASKTGIEDIRDVMAGLMYRPLGEGAVKAVIIDECQALSKSAVTSLLKSLEEPQPWVLWFLCTTEPNKIPKAIQTRCLSIQLKDVSSRDLISLLESTEEGKDVPPEVVDVCVAEAGGSPRQALSNLGVCLAAKDKREAAELLRSADQSREAFELARALMQGASWSQLQPLFEGLKETSAESIRRVVRAYMMKVLLDPKARGPNETALAVLEEFSQPFYGADDLAPVVLACGRLLCK